MQTIEKMHADRLILSDLLQSSIVWNKEAVRFVELVYPKISDHEN